MLNPLVTIIQVLPQLYDGYISLVRISEYCNSRLDQDLIQTSSRYTASSNSPTSKEEIINLSKASFQWSHGYSLAGIDFSLNCGESVLLRGKPGSGKSTFLFGMLSEIRLSGGSMSIKGNSIAYCAQTPWLLNVTIRENILLGHELLPSRYRNILHYCSLEEDLDVLPARDLTVVGHNGSRLSGGQRKRVALARALYQQSNILLLDDIFSGLDERTTDRIRSNLFGRQGFLALEGRTAIVTTADCKSMDHSTVLTDGEPSLPRTPGGFHNLARIWETYFHNTYGFSGTICQ
jgi:ATP-binding cassette, subfamily C (CFTR/MRP), member 1